MKVEASTLLLSSPSSLSPSITRSAAASKTVDMESSSSTPSPTEQLIIDDPSSSAGECRRERWRERDLDGVVHLISSSICQIRHSRGVRG